MAFYVDNYLKDKKLAADAAIEAGNVVLAEGELVEFCSTSVPSFLRAGNLLNETENLLAGKFDNVGGYKITEPIIRELIAVNKIVEESFDNRLILCSKNKNDEKLSLKFSMTFSNKGEKRACSLFLLEKIYNNSVFATLKSTLLATYTDANDANFETKCKKVFNYKTKQEGDGQEYMNEELVRLLIAQKLSLMFSWKNLEIGLESECENYLQELIALLKKSGKYGEFVLARFLKAKSALGLSEKNIGKDYYKKLVDLMHKELLAAGGGKIPLSVKTKWLELLAKREEGIKTLIDFRPISKDPSKSTAKPASKSSGGGGSGGKKGGKKGGNKGDKNSGDSKKKDDKKKRAYGAPDKSKRTATDKRDKSKRIATDKRDKSKRIEASILRDSFDVADSLAECACEGLSRYIDAVHVSESYVGLDDFEVSIEKTVGAIGHFEDTIKMKGSLDEFTEAEIKHRKTDTIDYDPKLSRVATKKHSDKSAGYEI